MRLQVSVNNGVPVRASLESQGWLSVHLNLSAGDVAEGSQGRLRVVAMDKSSEPNFTISTWEIGALSTGDTAEIRILQDGEADPPNEVKRTAESPKNLFTNIDQASGLLSMISAFDKELMLVLEQSRSKEPSNEFQKIARAIGSVVTELDLSLIQPILRRHPELFAKAKEKNLV
jgi:hypothetical protein